MLAKVYYRQTASVNTLGGVSEPRPTMYTIA